jgi:chemotaxis protein MotA
MFVFIGIAVVIGGVMGGFMMHGGPPGVLLQWNEFLIIGGAGIGSLLIGTPVPILKRLMGSVTGILKGDRYTKDEYIKVLKTMFDIFNLAKREGLIALESHVMEPDKSPVFSKNAFLLQNHHALAYFCDTIKLLLGGGVPPQDVEALLDADMDSHHAETATPSGLVQKLGDALPGLGIVAAVLGIVITMQAINGPPEEIGEKVAAALVGTFLGILLSYGFLQPVATHIELLAQSESRYLECIKAGVVAYAKGNAPIIVVEFARRVIFSNVRPTFEELESAMREQKTSSGE